MLMGKALATCRPIPGLSSSQSGLLPVSELISASSGQGSCLILLQRVKYLTLRVKPLQHCF